MVDQWRECTGDSDHTEVPKVTLYYFDITAQISFVNRFTFPQLLELIFT